MTRSSRNLDDDSILTQSDDDLNIRDGNEDSDAPPPPRRTASAPRFQIYPTPEGLDIPPTFDESYLPPPYMDEITGSPTFGDFTSDLLGGDLTISDEVIRDPLRTIQDNFGRESRSGTPRVANIEDMSWQAI